MLEFEAAVTLQTAQSRFAELWRLDNAEIPPALETLPLDITVAAAALLIPYALYASKVKESKRRAWFLTLVTASVCGPLSLKYVFATVAPAFDGAAQFTDDRLARFLCTFFGCFLVLDTVVGTLHYPKSFHLLEGWIHHAVYAAFFGKLVQWGYTVGGATTLCLEIPTAILARGHCFPHLRVDLPFGLAFFAIRVVFHSYMLVKWVAIPDPPLVLWPCTAGALALHVWWFQKWCASYARSLKQKKPLAA